MKYILEFLTAVTILIIICLFAVQNAAVTRSLQSGEGAWAGADRSAAGVIEKSGYTPWFSPVFTPPSSEIETLFFCIPVAAGSLVIGYFFGYYRAQSERD